MFGAIMVHVAALAEGCEVLRGVIRRVVIAVPGGQNHACGAHASQDVIDPDRQTDEVPSPIAPGDNLRVPPATIAEMEYGLPMWAGADLTAALRPLEADHGRELRPVDGIEEAVLASVRHGYQPCRDAMAAAAWLRARAWGK